MTQKKIDSILSLKYYHIFYSNKELKPLAQKTISDVGKAIKENVNPPKTDKKVYMVRLKYNPDSEKRKLIINCSQNTITPKLVFAMDKYDDSFNIIYSEEEYKKYKFSLAHIKKIISKIKKNELDLDVQFINISSILK
jgi:hypothetical protein